MKIRITELGAPMTKAESIAQAIAKSQNPNLMRATVIFKSWRELELKIEDVSGPIQRFPKVGANLIAPEWRLPIPGIHHTALHAEIYAEHSHSTPVIRFVLKLFAAENRTLSYEPFEWFIRIALKPVELHFGEFGEDGPELHVTKDVDIYGVLRLIGGWNLPAAKHSRSCGPRLRSMGLFIWRASAFQRHQLEGKSCPRATEKGGGSGHFALIVPRSTQRRLPP
jgi:hypothetical protein